MCNKYKKPVYEMQAIICQIFLPKPTEQLYYIIEFYN